MNFGHRLAGLCVLGLAVGGCASPPAASATGTSQPDPATSSSGVRTDLTLTFAGDVTFTEHTNPKAFSAFTGLLSRSDLTLATLSHVPGLRALEALRAAGVDAVSLANDQITDAGTARLAQQLGTAESGPLPAFGAGLDSAKAYRPWRTEVNGVRVSVVGLNQVEQANDTGDARPDRPGVASARNQALALEAVRTAGRDSDLVVVMPHWGNRRTSCVSLAQRDFAARLRDAGADVVVGTHSSAVQGVVDRKGSPFVAFGLGSLLGSSTGGAVLNLTLRDGNVVDQELVPVTDHAGPVRDLPAPRYCASSASSTPEDVFSE